MNDTQIEKMRHQLQEQMRGDYFDKLKNEDDPSAERYELIGTVSMALDRLLEVESKFLTETLGSDDGICPSCLLHESVDVANVKAVAMMFNHYLKQSTDLEH